MDAKVILNETFNIVNDSDVCITCNGILAKSPSD